MEEILEEIKTALDEKEISTATATRLTLKALMVTLASEKVVKQKIEILEKNPLVRIGFFLQKNPQVGIASGITVGGIIFIPHIYEIVAMAKELIEKHIGITLP
jgi:hypothetical protein